MGVQAGRAVDLAKEVLRDVALIQGVLEAMCQEVEVPFHLDPGDLDQDVKVGQAL